MMLFVAGFMAGLATGFVLIGAWLRYQASHHVARAWDSIPRK